jgi:uncharacterized protein (DUF58 family)
VMSGGYSSVFRGAGVEFDEVREYEEGDDPRTVDWNVTARTGRPHVKKYVDERQLTVLFLLDVSASSLGGFGEWSARRTAARLCACLALTAVKNHDKVGLVTFGREVEKYVPARRGVRHALRIVRDCLAPSASGEGTRLAPALDFATRTVRRGAVLFVVSDFFADDWSDALAVCARRHDVIAARLLAPELAPPSAGLIRLRDPESGRETTVDWSDARARAIYSRRVEDWRRETEARLRRAETDLMDVPVPRVRDKDVVARPILKFFQMRERRGAKR